MTILEGLRDPARARLAGVLIGLARATEGNEHMLSDSTAEAAAAGLRALCAAGQEDLQALWDRVDAEKRKLVPACYSCVCSCGRTENYNPDRLGKAPRAVREQKHRLLAAACALGVAYLEMKDPGIPDTLYRSLYAVGMEDWEEAELLPFLEEAEAQERKIRGR